jgi:hypothetical protein
MVSRHSTKLPPAGLVITTESRIFRWKLLNAASDAWRTVRGGSPAVAARQKCRLTALVDFVTVESPFYKGLCNQLLALSDLQELPPVTKADLMANFDERVTDLTEGSRNHKSPRKTLLTSHPLSIKTGKSEIQRGLS